MKKIEFDLENNPFINFHSARYTMSARINVEKLWKFTKENDCSFFILSLGCLTNAVNNVDNIKRRIISGEAVEYEYLESVTPIMTEGSEEYDEMRVKTPQCFSDMIEWHDYVRKLAQDILAERKKGFSLEMEKRDYTNIANYSCIPWVDFDSITNCVLNPEQIQPLITWGKVNSNFEMSVSITVSHIFVHGRDLAHFFENAQREFDSF